MKKLISLITFLIIFCSNSSSQHNNWINYTYSYGLRDFEETLNFYWLATSGGLAKVNKTDNTVEVLTKANSLLGNNSSVSLYTNSDRNLLVGTQPNNSQMGGFLKFDGENWSFIELEGEFWSAGITNLSIDKYNSIWFGIGDGIAKYDGNNIEFRQLLTGEESYGLYLSNIFFDHPHFIF